MRIIVYSVRLKFNLHMEEKDFFNPLLKRLYKGYKKLVFYKVSNNQPSFRISSIGQKTQRCVIPK